MHYRPCRKTQPQPLKLTTYWYTKGQLNTQSPQLHKGRYWLEWGLTNGFIDASMISTKAIKNCLSSLGMWQVIEYKGLMMEPEAKPGHFRRWCSWTKRGMKQRGNLKKRANWPNSPSKELTNQQLIIIHQLPPNYQLYQQFICKPLQHY